MSKIPREIKKGAHRNEMKEAATAANTHQKENITRKNVAHKDYKGVSTWHDMQEQLKEQNQQLTAANEQLQKNLSETQQRVTHLEQQFSDLGKENSVLQKNLKDCQILLVATKIDLVSGEVFGEAARQDEEQRKEVMSVSADVLRELKDFSDMASQQRSRLQEIQTTMTNLSEARQHMLQERETFSLEAAEMEKALMEAEALLL
uniref:small kinetochore-associated protein n=1 Tax=Doryrhamphus excisus TaxID=161450 RepID=UPI0025AE28ED|nr:small kinetochore-associated protein [Doryrhamphus excisus]